MDGGIRHAPALKSVNHVMPRCNCVMIAVDNVFNFTCAYSLICKQHNNYFSYLLV